MLKWKDKLNKSQPQIKTTTIPKSNQLSTTSSMLLEHIEFLSSRVQDLEKLVIVKNRKISSLEAKNKQLIYGNVKRDEIITAALDENRKLRETTKWYEEMKQSNLES